MVERIEGSESVEGVLVRNVQSGEGTQRAAAGVFIFIGHTPNGGLLRGLVETDAAGHAVVDLEMRTKVPGIFAAGDVRVAAARQLVSACGDGATAAIAAEKWLAAAPARQAVGAAS